MARDQWANMVSDVSTEIKNWSERIPWLYNRAVMTVAGNLPVFKYFDKIQPAMVPKDSDLVKDWLNLQHTRSLKQKGARVDFNAPIEMDICIIPDTAM